MKPRWANVIVFILISACFSAAVYKIDQNAIHRVERAQALAAKANQRTAQVCRRDIDAINSAHASIKGGFLLQASISRDNANAIRLGFREDLIPPSLHEYYVRALHRQEHNRAAELRFARRVQQLIPLC